MTHAEQDRHRAGYRWVVLAAFYSLRSWGPCSPARFPTAWDAKTSWG